MRISYNWLKDYVDIKLPPEKLAETLTMAGCAVGSVEKAGSRAQGQGSEDDYILELEVTANRPDLLSVIGVAREVAALTGKRLKPPPTITVKVKGQGSRVKVTVEDRTLCQRYTARIIRGVKVGESPDWLKTRIEAMGLRPVNNIVDITNFCLFETGEPMHAFDLDKLGGSEVVVRRAKKGEKIVTIEGSEKVLGDTNFVIADSTKPIAIAGVMGGISTEVNYSTKNILLEAACFDPISVRRTALVLAIATESSYRFERKVDIENIKHFSDRAAGLILELAGGEPGEFIDIGSKKPPEKHIELRFNRLDRILGEKISAQKVKRILGSLGLPTKAPSNEKAKFKVPSFRPDLNCEVDLIEEVARVYGYDNIPDTIPAISEQPVRTSREIEVAKSIRACLAGLGIDEIVTYGLMGQKALEASEFSGGSIVELKNPLTNEQAMMRPSLIPGMLGAILWNLNRKTRDLKLFELGNIYIKEGSGKFAEKKYLCIGMTGQAQASWVDQARPVGFFDLKGVLETLLLDLGVGSFSFKQTKDGRLARAECASIYVDGSAVGVLGLAGRKILNNFDIKEKVYILEIDIDAVMKSIKLEKRFEKLPKYPSILRDISVVIDKEILNADIMQNIKDTAGAILKGVSLIDRYVGKQIPDGKIGLTYRLEYQDPSRTLEEKDVAEVHSKIIRALEEKFGARLR